MYIPVEIQREILSYAGYYFPQSKSNKGRCFCKTKFNKRCKKRVDYTKKLFCNIHYSNNFMESILILYSKKLSR